MFFLLCCHEQPVMEKLESNNIINHRMDSVSYEMYIFMVSLLPFLIIDQIPYQIELLLETF